MKIPFGMHRGQTVEDVLLDRPDYVIWMLSQHDADGWVARFQKPAREAIAAFNRCRFERRCLNGSCGKRATTGSVVQGSSTVQFWCTRCNPAPSRTERLLVMGTFGEARDASRYCADPNDSLRGLVRTLAVAKGLRPPLDETDRFSWRRV